MTLTTVVLLIVIDISVVVVISVLAGLIAPRLADRQLEHDHFLLHRWQWETPGRYRSLGASWLAARLPELGTIFGGQSKSELPGTDRNALLGYLREVRRAEIVHWVSFLSWVPLLFFNPWWLTLSFAIIVTFGNGLFLLILRYNKSRLLRLIERG